MYAEPRHVTDVGACSFYHTVDLPTLGTLHGQWDLRPNLDRYLSSLDYRGKRVLEVGTADGQICFELERRGAEVVALDLRPGLTYDVVPVADAAVPAILAGMQEGLERIRNAYWLSHRLLQSRARVVYGHACDLPAGTGSFDCIFIGNVLQHLENPLRAIEHLSRVTRDAIVITEAYWDTRVDQASATATFLPSFRGSRPLAEWCFSWWQLTSGVVRTWLELLGFRIAEQYEHQQWLSSTQAMVPHFTVVAKRASPVPPPGVATE